MQDRDCGGVELSRVGRLGLRPTAHLAYCSAPVDPETRARPRRMRLSVSQSLAPDRQLFSRVELVVILLLIGILGNASNAECEAGKLDDVRDEIRNGPDDREPRQRSRSHTHDCDDDPPGFFSRLMGDTVVFTTSAPWWLPRSLLEDTGEWSTFPPAPYAEDHPGYLVIDAVDPLGTDNWSVRLSTEYGTDFGDLSRIGAHLLVDTSSRFGVETEWNQWIEASPVGDDSLATGDFNLIYRFAQHERVQFRSGLGLNWLADAGRGDIGFNFTYGVDVFPAQPLTLSAVLDVGSLGDALYFHGRSTVGVVWGPAEIFTGYDYQRIGRVNLQGLVAGVQVWF